MEGVHEAPHDIENPKDPLQKKLDNLSPLSSLRCVYRVPKRLRRVNEKAYTPQVVSIGPLHHGKEHLKAMEEHKKRYLRHFLNRTRERVSFSDYIQMIGDKEGRLRGSYAEPIEFGSDQFVRIVLVDAAFIIEFLLRCRDSNCEGYDYIFNNPKMRWDVLPDLRLLENQLPFFILQVLFDTLSSPAHPRPSLLEISYSFFVSQIVRKGKEVDSYEICSTEVQVQHFVDLIRILHPPLKSKTRRELKTTAVPNAAELLQAGVKFEVGKGTNLFDIKFSDGILEIPTLIVADNTDRTLRNLLAFEQRHKREDDCLTSYVFLLKRLAKTPKDVELLVEHGIIVNWLGSTKKISTLLHDLGTGPDDG
ncbi:hypothetical protein D8674_015011 [Pyrus ussuriensis x Pyrus communis]|uniref:Uncharacterized protein n=1 Tax=Pyrus ussuriensis x Pyrus communis TaxID=2448454 RepID=A0A5N5GZC5_9ROSA|nr:hypothetical protein D8674_015011 [Pyrus ussuriensis x Pyrus communis]